MSDYDRLLDTAGGQDSSPHPQTQHLILNGSLTPRVDWGGMKSVEWRRRQLERMEFYLPDTDGI